jgi:hypothetical protein
VCVCVGGARVESGREQARANPLTTHSRINNPACAVWFLPQASEPAAAHPRRSRPAPACPDPGGAPRMAPAARHHLVEPKLAEGAAERMALALDLQQCKAGGGQWVRGERARADQGSRQQSRTLPRVGERVTARTGTTDRGKQVTIAYRSPTKLADGGMRAPISRPSYVGRRSPRAPRGR